MISRISTSLIVSATLAACATHPVEQVGIPPVPLALMAAAGESLAHVDPEVLYYVGAAEILGRREEYQQSAEFYLQAALRSSDPKIAERAVQVSVFANNEALTLQGVQRWVELDPDADEPHRYAAILHLRSGADEDAWQHIAAMLGADASNETWEAVIKMLGASPSRATAASIYARLSTALTTPRNEAVQQQLSDLGVRLGHLTLAEQYASQAIELNPHSAEYYSWRGRLRTSLNRLQGAKADFERAVQLDADNQSLRQSYAALLAEIGDYQGALEQLNRVDDSLMVVFSKGLYANAAQRPNLAEQYYLALQDVGSEDESEKFFLLGQLAETLAKPLHETLAWYEQVRSGERLDDAKMRSALVLASAGELAQARAILRKLQNGNARTAANAYLAEAGLLRNAVRLDEALDVYSEALTLLPDNTDLLFARALLAEELDHLEMAEQDLRQVLELDPNDANALNALGYTLADRTDRYDEALALIERALEQLPDEPAVVDSMGWIHYKLGQYETALQYLQRALEMQYDSEIAAHLGEVLWALGRQEEARELWNEALRREPDSAILTRTLERYLAE